MLWSFLGVPHLVVLVLEPSQQYKAPQFYTHQFDPPTSFTNLNLDTPTFFSTTNPWATRHRVRLTHTRRMAATVPGTGAAVAVAVTADEEAHGDGKFIVLP